MMEFGGHLCYGLSNKENPRFLVQLDMCLLWRHSVEILEIYSHFLTEISWK